MNPDDLKKLKVTGSCAMGDLQDADLRGIDLRGVNLLAAPKGLTQWRRSSKGQPQWR